MSHPDPLAEFVDRVRNIYLPTFVAAWARKHLELNAVVPGFKLTFDPDEIRTNAETIAAFLRAVDEGVVERRPTSFGLPRDFDKKRCPLFQHPDQKTGRIGFWDEGPMDVATAGRLVLDFGWPREHLGFRSRRDHFDVSVYGSPDDARRDLAIACESKASQAELEQLGEDIAACGAIGDHEWETCRISRIKENHHNKYRGLVRLHPELLWLIGPEQRHLFRVRYEEGDLVVLVPEADEALRFPGPVTVDGAR